MIDDSATIRKLVDTHLTHAGYRVVFLRHAEVGLELAAEIEPDRILLDTNCRAQLAMRSVGLVTSPTVRRIRSSSVRRYERERMPSTSTWITSSTCFKPYTEELLRTTVANAIETAVVVVSSQSGGTTVPEVIQQLDDAGLAGSFAVSVFESTRLPE